MPQKPADATESRHVTYYTVNVQYRAGFKEGAGSPGPRPPTNRGPPTKLFIFFSFVICVSCIF